MVTKKQNNVVKLNMNKDIINIHEENINKFAGLMNEK
jgi:menaquinone-dependent protoporphyrinogen oxidase